MVRYIKDRLLRLKPSDENDIPGWVYVYYRQRDWKIHQDKLLSHLILYKVGRTKNHPDKRISDQEKINNDGIYLLKETFATKYSIYFEFMIHIYFDTQRVVRPELLDGKTEWFLVNWEELRSVIMSVKTFMVRFFNDCGADRHIPNHRYNLRSKNNSTIASTRIAAT